MLRLFKPATRAFSTHCSTVTKLTPKQKKIYNLGFKHALQVGEKIGRQAALLESGFNEGWKLGEEEGKKKGFKKGKEEGLEIGNMQGFDAALGLKFRNQRS